MNALINSRGESTVTVKNATTVILARYHWILGRYHEANRERNWVLAEGYQGQLLGLAFALGALDYKEDLPR